MNARMRPSGCCTLPNVPMPLADDERQSLVAMHKALADSTRFDIFRFVAAQQEPICACDVVDRFDVSQPTISHHMKVLSDAGLIRVSRRGVWAYYEVDGAGVARLVDSLSGVAGGVLVGQR